MKIDWLIRCQSLRVTLKHDGTDRCHETPHRPQIQVLGIGKMCLVRVSRNTAPRAPRTPRAPPWSIVKTSRRWCLGCYWISSKISRKRWIGEEGELTKGQYVQWPAVHVYSHCGARGLRGARGAVFRDIGLVRCILLILIKKRNRLRFSCISDLHFFTSAAYSV